jgi:hypothetical protein
MMPVGFRIASAYVEVNADAKGLRQQIKNAVESAAKGQEAKIQLDIATRGLRKQVETALKEATKGQKPQVAIGIRSTGLRKEVTEALKAATAKQKPTVRLGISSVGLRAEVQRALAAATKDQKPTVRLGISSIGLRNEVQRALNAATAGQQGTVRINADLDTDRVQRALADLDPEITPRVDIQDMRQRLMSAIRRININEDVTINPNIDGDALRAKIKAEVDRLRDRYKVQLTPDVDTDTFAARIREAARNVSTDDIPLTFDPVINQLRLRAEAQAAAQRIRENIIFGGRLRRGMLKLQVEAAVRALNAMPHDLTFRANLDTTRLMAKIAAINALVDDMNGKMSRWARLTIMASLAVTPALAIVDNALRKTSAASGVLVGYFAAMVTVGATFAVGMNNVVNAITSYSHSLEKYSGYLEQLTPNARQFVTTIIDINGVFKELQATVQETLFSGLAKEIREMSEVTIPSFTVGLGGMALVLNSMAKDTFNTAETLAKMGTLDAMFGGLQLAMEPLIPMPGQILNAVVKLATASMPLIIRMHKAFESWSETMTQRLNRAFADGTLQSGITKAGDQIVNFFRRIANNPQFTEFMDRLKANGPAMSEMFGNITEAALKIINALAPVSALILRIADAFASFVNALPVEVLTLVISKLVLFKAALLISGFVIKLTSAVMMLQRTLGYLGSQAAMVSLISTRLQAMGASAAAINATALAMRVLGRAIVGALAITTVAWAIDALADRAKGAAPDVEKLQTALQKLGSTGKFTGELKKTFGDIDGFVEAMDKLKKAQGELAKNKNTLQEWGEVKNRSNPIGDWFWNQVDKITKGSDSLEALKDDFKSFDQALAAMVNGGYQSVAAKDFKLLADAWVKGGGSLKDFKKEFPEYAAAVEAAAVAQKISAESMGLFGEKAIEVSDRIKTLQAETEGLVKSLFELNGIQRTANQSVRDLAQTAEEMVKATKKKAIGLRFENGQLIQNSTAAQAAAKSMEDHAAQTEKTALATYTATGNWDAANKVLTTNKQKIIDAAVAAGMGAEEARNYADSILDIPTQKQINIMVADQATEQLGKVAEAYRAAPDSKVITVSALNTSAIQALETLGYKVTQLPDGRFRVLADTVPAEADLKKVENYKIDPKTVQILANITSLTVEIQNAQTTVDRLKQRRAVAIGAEKKKLDKEITKAQKKLDDLKQQRAAEIKALDKTGPEVKSAKDNIDSVKGKTVTISILTHLAGPSVSDTADAIRRQAEAQARAAKNKWTGGVIRRAGGGAVAGPGGPKSDKIAALLSNGEYVIRASSVNKYGMSMMNAINQGRWPRFAEGGAVKGSGGVSAGSGVRAGETTGTFTVKDGTGKPVASAVQNFKALRTALGQTYADMNAKTSVFATQFTQRSAETFKGATGAASKFSRDQVSSLASTRNKSNTVWNGFKSGMTARTGQAYKAIQNQTAGFQRSQVAATTRTSQSTQATWNNWRTGMVNRTNSTYKTLNNATSAFSKNSVSRIAGARDGMGSAWGGLSPRFKPPVSYLIHTVLNKGMVGSMNAMMSKLGGGKKVSGVSVAGFATGGPVYGAGTKTSDSIPARLSNGEFVMQAKAVDKFGVGFMSMVNQGKMPKDGAGFTGFSKGGGVNIKMAAPGFAAGGAVGVPSADALNKILGDGDSVGVKRMTDFIMNNYVLPLIDSGPGGSAMKDVQRAGMNHIRKNVESFVKDNFGGAGSAAAGLRWAKTQHGKPYQWGGNGNPSWDCSGFMSAIESVIRGEKPHRRWSTHAFQGGAPSGWKAGANAPFRVGITHAGVGHTAGTIGKTNVESSGNGVQVGSGARGYNHPMFTSWYGYVGPNATKKAHGGYISGPGGPTADKVPAWLSNGEYVIRAAAVKKLGTGYLSALNSGKIPGFASGGSAKKKKLPAHIQSTEGVNALKNWVTHSKEYGWAGATGNETTNAFRGHESVSDLIADMRDVAAKIATAFKGSVETKLMAQYDKNAKAAINYQKKLVTVNKALETAQDKLAELKESFDSMKKSVSDAVLDFGKVTKIGTYGTSGDTLLNQLQKDVDRSGAFAKQLEQLKKKGVDSSIIGQIAEAGITGGGAATAQTILNMTPEQLKKLNDLQAQLKATADKAGTTAADAMYGAGLKSAQGLVDGLTAQKKAIEDKMMEIAKAMETAIKKALGIKSPSRVMMAVADFTADGLVNQLIARKSDAEKAMATLVSPTAMPAATTRTVLPGNGTMVGGGNTQVVNIQNLNVCVDGTFPLDSAKDRRALATALVKEIKEEIRKDDKKRR